MGVVASLERSADKRDPFSRMSPRVFCCGRKKTGPIPLPAPVERLTTSQGPVAVSGFLCAARAPVDDGGSEIEVYWCAVLTLPALPVIVNVSIAASVVETK